MLTATAPITQARLLLQRGQASRLPGAQATRLTSAAGTLWITVDHDTRDVVLEPGQSFTVQNGEPVTVSALSGPAVLDWQTPGVQP